MDVQNPEVSVGMPVYNGERWLAEAIESILDQSFDRLELIISDNDSTDGTEEICRSYAARDPRVRYLRQEKNLGASDNYNFVFRSARAPYFKWASSNDICHERFLESCLAQFRDRPDLALCYPRARLFIEQPEDGEDYHDGLDLPEDSPCRRFERLVSEMALNNVMNGVIRSEVLGRTPLIKPYYSSDIVLMAEVALHGKVAEVPEFLFFRRMDEKTATRLKSEEEVVEHYDPSKRSMMLFQRWRLHLGYLGAALRAPLSAGERACVLSKVLRNVRWDRWHLATEIWEAAQKVSSRRATQ